MIEIKDLLDLPWVTLLTLASGYASYFIANYGKREHHKAIDVAFSVLVFALVSASLYGWLLSLEWNDPLSSLITFLAALLTGAVWSWIGHGILCFVVRKTNISQSNDLHSAWGEFSAVGEKVNPTQIEVLLIDGTKLFSDDLSLFSECPNGPFVMGASGDMMIYVTRKSPKDGKAVEVTNVIHPWGPEVTYLPKEQIASVKVRRQWNKDRG